MLGVVSEQTRRPSVAGYWRCYLMESRSGPERTAMLRSDVYVRSKQALSPTLRSAAEGKDFSLVAFKQGVVLPLLSSYWLSNPGQESVRLTLTF